MRLGESKHIQRLKRTIPPANSLFCHPRARCSPLSAAVLQRRVALIGVEQSRRRRAASLLLLLSGADPSRHPLAAKEAAAAAAAAAAARLLLPLPCLRASLPPAPLPAAAAAAAAAEAAAAPVAAGAALPLLPLQLRSRPPSQGRSPSRGPTSSSPRPRRPSPESGGRKEAAATARPTAALPRGSGLSTSLRSCEGSCRRTRSRTPRPTWTR